MADFMRNEYEKGDVVLIRRCRQNPSLEGSRQRVRHVSGNLMILTGGSEVFPSDMGHPDVSLENSAGGGGMSGGLATAYSSAMMAKMMAPPRMMGGGWDPITMDEAKPAPPKPRKKPDFKHLDALIVDEGVKTEITGVLKQHEHSKKLFEEWGLGEVIEYGRGMTFLFYGPPGTGKTHAANCIAKVMNTELISIGQAEIQSSEPGAANRNIQNAFKEATESGKVLLIDECDSLICNRADLGMILAGEVNTLLTEIEKFEGVCVLATNRIENMDEALERRISLITEFPKPNFETRKKIWTRMLPKKMPREDDVTVEALSEYELTGGLIKNVVLQAARLALADGAKKVTRTHFDTALTRVLKSQNLMGTESRYGRALNQGYGKRADLKKERTSFLDMELEKVESDITDISTTA